MIDFNHGSHNLVKFPFPLLCFSRGKYKGILLNLPKFLQHADTVLTVHLFK